MLYRKAYINMPNHITNRLKVEANHQVLATVLAFLRGEPFEDGTPCFIDFNKIVPMPKGLDIVSSSLGEIGMEYLVTKQKPLFYTQEQRLAVSQFENLPDNLKDEALRLSRQYLRNIADTGFKDWHGWSVKNWGTKWNAYKQHFEEPNIIWFATAWSDVSELIRKVSEKFPDVEFSYAYADEDTGCNTGSVIFKNGIGEVYHPVDQSVEAYELAFELNPDSQQYYELTDTGYSYKKEED